MRSGFAGQVSFGHASLFGIGAYVTIILYLRAGVAPWWGIPVGGAIAALVSLPTGLLCFRLRGPYFSLATLAARVGMTAAQVSQIINERMGLSFYDMVNTYRVEEAKKRLLDPKQLDATFRLDLAHRTQLYPLRPCAVKPCPPNSWMSIYSTARASLGIIRDPIQFEPRAV